MPHLEITKVGHPRTVRHPLDDGPVTIGRSPGNVLPLAEMGVSREHCVVEPDGDGYRLRDLGSRNGIAINGQRTARKRSATPTRLVMAPKLGMKTSPAASEPRTAPSVFEA